MWTTKGISTLARLVNGKITLGEPIGDTNKSRPHPAMDFVGRAENAGEHPEDLTERLAAVDEEHTESGAHRTTAIPFPDWVPVEVITAARLLSVEEALALLPACLH